MRIVLDGMGGDNAPQVVVEGAVAATKEMLHEIIIVGQEEVINECLKSATCRWTIYSWKNPGNR